MKNSNFKIPIFPLDGVILLPESLLPLNIFEKKYLYMVDDSLKTNSRLIGIVQPIMKKKDMIPSFKILLVALEKLLNLKKQNKIPT